MHRRVAVLLLALAASGCVTFSSAIYAHQTLDGARFQFKNLDKVVEGMNSSSVREALGEPLKSKVSAGISEWRYFERANPRWCDAGGGKAPEYTIEVNLVFRDDTLVSKAVKQVGTPVFP